MISLGSIVQRNLELLSMLEPAAASEGMPAAAIVAPTSLASRPVSVRLRAPKLSSQLREVISTLLTRQTTDSASTEIFVLGVKPNLVLPRNRRAMTRLSKARTAGECSAMTAANAKAFGPLAVPGAANAVLCTTVRANAGMISFFICAASVRNPSALGDADAAKLEWRRVEPMSLASCSLQDSCFGLNPQFCDGSQSANSRVNMTFRFEWIETRPLRPRGESIVTTKK